jgi:hypothetical protein
MLDQISLNFGLLLRERIDDIAAAGTKPTAGFRAKRMCFHRQCHQLQCFTLA